MATQPQDTHSGQASAVAAEVLCTKIRSSKRILFGMLLTFGCSAWAVAGTEWCGLATVLTAVSCQHFLYHVWCDSDNIEIMLARHGFHVYLVMFSDLLIMWVCSDYSSIFAKGLTFLVMPVAFAREAESWQHSVTFLSLHFGLATYICKDDLLGEGGQWLANLLILDIMSLDMTLLRATGSEAGTLLEKAYSMSQRASHDSITHFLTCLCDAFVTVVGEDMILCEDSATLGAMLFRNPANSGRPFTDFVDYEERDHLREHFQKLHGSGSGNTCTTASLKVKLLDDLNYPIGVLLIFAKLWGPEGEYLYYIGICHASHTKADKPDKKSRSGSRSRSSSRRMLSSDLNYQPAPLEFLHPIEGSSSPPQPTSVGTVNAMDGGARRTCKPPSQKDGLFFADRQVVNAAATFNGGTGGGSA